MRGRTPACVGASLECDADIAQTFRKALLVGSVGAACAAITPLGVEPLRPVKLAHPAKPATPTKPRAPVKPIALVKPIAAPKPTLTK